MQVTIDNLTHSNSQLQDENSKLKMKNDALKRQVVDIRDEEKKHDNENIEKCKVKFKEWLYNDNNYFYSMLWEYLDVLNTLIILIKMVSMQL